MIFRYPGGKRKLLAVIMHHLCPRIERAEKFCDVFIGGGSVLIEVAKTYPGLPMIANDLDTNMAAFWDMVANGTDEDWDRLEYYLEIEPSVEQFYALRELKPKSKTHKAYYAIFFNRCTFSGISTSGPIGGKEQKSKYTVDCRYNATKIIKQCRALRKLFAGRLKVTNLTFQDFFALHVPEKSVSYCDPPYYMKGPELYPCSMDHEDHEDLAEILKDEKSWVLSYDHCGEIKQLYTFANCLTVDARYSINGIKNTWSNKQEFLITEA